MCAEEISFRTCRPVWKLNKRIACERQVIGGGLSNHRNTGQGSYPEIDIDVENSQDSTHIQGIEL